MLAWFCIACMLLALFLSVLAFRALAERTDLKNDALAFKFKLAMHTVLVIFWCLGLKFLYLILAELLALLLPQSSLWIQGIAWAVLLTYPVFVLIAFASLWRGLAQGRDLGHLLHYSKIARWGLLPMFLVLAAVFFIWNAVN